MSALVHSDAKGVVIPTEAAANGNNNPQHGEAG